MGCSGCRAKAAVQYEVKFHDGTTQRYDTIGEAQQAGASSGQPYTFKAVPK